MPFRPERLKNLREAKALSQDQLSKLAGLSQSVIAKSENGKNLPGSEALDKLARALDCTIDYLHGRGYEYGSPGAAAANMAFDVFVASQVLTDEQIARCRRALQHPDAPKTAKAWHSFAEMIELAMGPTSTTSLALVGDRRLKPKSMAAPGRQSDPSG
ncbi:MAG: helix-turn-helix transcriptional regulator [Terriglobales bacterium]